MPAFKNMRLAHAVHTLDEKGGASFFLLFTITCPPHSWKRLVKKSQSGVHLVNFSPGFSLSQLYFDNKRRHRIPFGHKPQLFISPS